jgi:hypothetical protein
VPPCSTSIFTIDKCNTEALPHHWKARERQKCYMQQMLHRSLHHGGEGVGLERGAADERAVNVLLLKEAATFSGLAEPP